MFSSLWTAIKSLFGLGSDTNDPAGTGGMQTDGLGTGTDGTD